MASDGEGLTELCLEDWWWATDHQAVLDSNRESDSEPDVFRITREWLTAYFAGERPGSDQVPPLHPAGTPFQHEVWNLVAEIPYGMTVSYGELAAELAERRGGGRMAAQAVGGAVKRNPVTIIVPCHRVVGSGILPRIVRRRCSLARSRRPKPYNPYNGMRMVNCCAQPHGRTRSQDHMT